MEKGQAIKLQVAEHFEVSVQRLYQAWVAPDELKKWWHPLNSHLSDVQLELKPVGAYQYQFQNEKGDGAFAITGTYKEVAENSWLVYSWNWQLRGKTIQDGHFKLLIEFYPQGSSSRLQVTQKNFAEEEAVHPHREGWDKALTDLKQYLEKV